MFYLIKTSVREDCEKFCLEAATNKNKAIEIVNADIHSNGALEKASALILINFDEISDRILNIFNKPEISPAIWPLDILVSLTGYIISFNGLVVSGDNGKVVIGSMHNFRRCKFNINLVNNLIAQPFQGSTFTFFCSR